MSSENAQLRPILERMDYGRALKGALVMGKTDAPNPYAQPLLDAVALFEELKIGYALVGGIAAMYYGRARFTEDVDFVAVTGHGDVLAAHPDTMQSHHFSPDCTYKLYHQSGVQVDLWKDQFADQIVNGAIDAELAGRNIRMADVHDLIAMKLRSGRLKDDYDIGEIARASALDEVKLRGLVTPEQFARYLEIRARI
jgi:hypothetical protein